MKTLGERMKEYEAVSKTRLMREHKQLAEWLTELKQRREAEITAPPKTNADRVRQMTDEELADIMQGQCACCAYQLTGCTEKECKDGAYEWLKQEAKDETG